MRCSEAEERHVLAREYVKTHLFTVLGPASCSGVLGPALTFIHYLIKSPHLPETLHPFK